MFLQTKPDKLGSGLGFRDNFALGQLPMMICIARQIGADISRAP
ncbi:MAG: hypothetical protein WA322_09000 [Pseudolabrys sp.]